MTLHVLDKVHDLYLQTFAYLFPVIIHQASEEASLRALESLMTEFFHSCTTNERKREIGKFVFVRLALSLRNRYFDVYFFSKLLRDQFCIT